MSPPITIMIHIYGSTLVTAGLHTNAVTANIDYVVMRANSISSAICSIMAAVKRWEGGSEMDFCSQPSKGGSQWSSSTLLQTEVDLALE